METKTPRIYTGNVRFPEALHGLLEDAEPVQFEHIISWLPCGMGFKIHDHKAFGSQIMPKYFLATALKSFKRNLSLYSFQKITVGPNKGEFVDIARGQHRAHFERGLLTTHPFISAY